MIPDFQSIMLPLMSHIQDGQEHSTKLIHDQLAKHFNLSNDELNEFLPSGNQRIFYNRVFWAKAHLKMAGLIENTRRGYFKITPMGTDVLSKNPSQINIAFLKQFPGYKESITSSKSTTETQVIDIESNSTLETPQESLDHSYMKIKFALEEDVLAKVKSCSPYFFEKLVVKLLMKMGYGGTSEESGIITGKSGDEGIDGVIKQDPLGLDMIYIQAKKWDGVVSRPEIQKFAGALTGQGAKKGVFITTSRFSQEALQYLSRNEMKIVLIDGQQLALYMVDYGLGVSVEKTYEVKRLDSDFFEEDWDLMKANAIIQDYKQRVRQSGDSLVKDCLRERDILKVIEMAGLSRNKNHTKHRHQHRLTNKVLREFADRLLRNANKIIASRSFNELHTIVNGLSLKGIGTPHRTSTKDSSWQSIHA